MIEKQLKWTDFDVHEMGVEGSRKKMVHWWMGDEEKFG
jgi:hypothetical protein